MLVPARQSKESLLIDEDIVITIISVQGNQVRNGIEAPKEVLVLRSEIAKREAAPPGSQ